MKYWIATDRFAAPTCDLTDEQYKVFRRFCDEIQQEHAELFEEIDENERPVLVIENRDNWQPSLMDLDLKKGEITFPLTLVKIYPETILNSAPAEFFEKKARYKEWVLQCEKDHAGMEKKHSKWPKTLILKDWELIERLLIIAREIENPFQMTVSSSTKHPNDAQRKSIANKNSTGKSNGEKSNETKRLSKYETYVEHYIEKQIDDIVQGNSKKYTIDKEDIITYFQDEIPEFKDLSKTTISRGIGRTDAWKNRKKRMSKIYDTPTYNNRKKKNGLYQDS